MSMHAERRILACGAHPDDIEIGCSGTLLKLIDGGAKVWLYIATGGERGGQAEQRRREAERAAEAMGAQQIVWGGFTDCEIPHTVELIESIESAVKIAQPDAIFTHYTDDTHQDHRGVGVATQSAARRVPNFLFYESPTTQHFQPTSFVDIGSTILRKLELLELHASQVARTNIESLPITDIARAAAIRRGIEVFCKYAEAFLPTRTMLIT